MKKLCGKVMCILLSIILYVGTLTLATADLLEEQYEVTVEEIQESVDIELSNSNETTPDNQKDEKGTDLEAEIVPENDDGSTKEDSSVTPSSFFEETDSLIITYEEYNLLRAHLSNLRIVKKLPFEFVYHDRENQKYIIKFESISDSTKAYTILSKNMSVEYYITPISFSSSSTTVDNTTPISKEIDIGESLNTTGDSELIKINILTDGYYSFCLGDFGEKNTEECCFDLYDQDLKKISSQQKITISDSFYNPDIKVQLSAGTYYLYMDGYTATLNTGRESGNGTPGNPYIISSKEDILNLCNMMLDDIYIEQVEDIVFSEEDFEFGGAFYNDGQGFEALYADMINYDGNGHSITNLKIMNREYASFLCAASIMTVYNLKILDCDISGDSAGAISSQPAQIIENYGNIAVTGKIKGSSAGGICESIGHYDLNMQSALVNSYFNGEIISSGSAGGLVSSLYCSIIENSFAVGRVTGKGTYVGGLVGLIYGAGGPMGPSLDRLAYISSCYANNVVNEGNANAVLGWGYEFDPTTEIRGVSMSRTYFNKEKTLSDSKNYKGASLIAIGLMANDFQQIDNLNGFYFDNIWKLDLQSGYKFPILQNVVFHSPKEKHTNYEYEKYTHKISLSHTSSSYLTSEGKVFTWGDNRLGQLGNETFSSREYPKELSIDSDVKIKKVVSGEAHSMALSEDGNVYLWGSNQFGQLGDGTLNNKLVPFHLPFNESVQDIAAAGNQSFVLTETGKVFAWGKNNYGQLGDGSEEDQHTPIEITEKFGGEEIIEIVPGEYCTFAMSTSGKLFGWGYNTKNNLGDSTHIRRLEPYDFSFLFNGVKIVHLSAAYQHTFAVTSDGELYVWGYNEFGQLGVTASEIGPTNISSLFDNEKIEKAFAGGTTSYVITNSGRVFAWGSNDKGQLADGSTADRNMPYEITSKFEGKRVIDIGAKKRHAYAETADGDIYFWGENTMGQLGDKTKQDSLIPINITKSFAKYVADSGLVFLSNSGVYQSPYFISEVSQFDGHVIANDIPINNFAFYSPDLMVDAQSGMIEQASDGKYFVYAVLKSKAQQVGTDYLNPIYQEYVIPFTVIVREIGEQIAASAESSAYLDTNGKLYLWGNNNRNQLLEDDIYYRSHLPIDVTAKMQDRIIDVQSGNYHSLILTEKGEVFSWGFNYNGQLGNGNTVNSKEFVKIPLQNIIAIDAGANQSFAIDKDGRLFAWGLNNYNQLGIGIDTDCYEPVQVSIEPISQIIAGNFSTFALTEDGKVYAWGYNSKGNLGDGSALRRREPFEITDKFAGEQIVKLVAGAQHAAALTANGQVYIWGYNDQGQLGSEIDGFSKLPLNITGQFSGTVKDIFAGGNATSVLMEDGTWFVFGANDKGQLGLGHTAEQKLPVENRENVGDIKKISMHFSHTLILSNGLYSSGLNERGQLGDESYTNRIRPVKVKFFKDIPANYGNVRARYNSVYYLTDDHKVYVWGENTQGELGDGTFETRFSPLDITDKFGGETVIKLEPGAALTESGEIFIWGEERARILGGINYDNVNIPTKFCHEFPAKIVDLYSSGRYYYAIDENDRVYFWGTHPVANKWAEQLIPQDVTAQFDNKKIDYFLLQDDFAIAVTKDKCIYGWGSNLYGALGDKISANEQKTPMNITSYLEGHTLKKTVAGDSHVFALTEEGKLYVWGYNGFCQIENSTSRKVTPKNIASRFDGRIVDVFAGYYSSGVLTQEGKLYVFGNNREGSLGHVGDGKELFDIGINLGGSLPVQICFCPSASIISTEDGKLFSSGNNTYGQLGIEQKSNSFFPIEIPFVLYRNTTAQPISMIAGKSLDYNYSIASYQTGSLELINSGIDNNLFRFYSQNSNIATVNESTGMITANAYGRTKIYAVLASRSDQVNGDYASLSNKNYFVEFEVVVRNADNSFHKELKVKYKKDDKFTIAITSPVLDIKDKIFTVTYGSQLVLDEIAPNTGITLGNNIEILSNNNNVLKFQLKNTASSVTKGLVAKVTFKALETGSSDIEIKVETKED